jgi:hypothetical protein
MKEKIRLFNNYYFLTKIVEMLTVRKKYGKSHQQF